MSRGHTPCYRLTAASLLLALSCCTEPLGLLGLAGDDPLGSLRVLPQTEWLHTPSPPDCVEAGQPATEIHWAMLEVLNQYRIENGLNPLTYSKRLEAVADAHVRDLWERGFFDHVNPDGQTPSDRAVEAGFCHEYVGENLAAGHKTVETAMKAWQDSPTHDENMLHPGFVYVGMGFFTDPTGRRYWGQLLAFDIPSLD